MDPTLKLWQYDWLQQGRSAATWDNMRRDVQRFERGLGKPLNSATMTDCLVYLAERQQVSASASAYAWRSLKSFYTFCSTLDETPSPMAKVKCPKVPEPAVKGVTEAEYKRLLLACGNHHRDKAVIALLYCTGLRRAELSALTLDDVNLEQQCLLVRKSKSGKPRVVPMSSEACVLLLRYLRSRQGSQEPLLWLGKKGPMTNDGMRLLIERRAKQAGVQVSAHNFRRAFAVNWLSKGGSQVSLMSICGWSSPAMPAKYTRHAASEVAQAEYRKMFG